MEALTWTALVAGLLLGPLGEIVDLPAATRKLSPFSHTPASPAAEVSLPPVLVMLLTAAALITVGLAGFHRRNLSLPS